jgi:hypothetical protein
MNNKDIFNEALDSLEQKLNAEMNNPEKVFGERYPADNFNVKMHNNEVTASDVNAYRAGADIEADVLRTVFSFVTHEAIMNRK